MSGPEANRPGVAVDYKGGAVVDPTENVMALVKAAVKAQEDLRLADTKFNDAQFSHMNEMQRLRAEHAKDIRISDLATLDKTRQVDVSAGATAAASLATAVSALAATADRNAENLRNSLNTTAQTIAKQTSDAATAQATQQAAIVQQINDRLATLEKASYQGAGKQSVSDPQMEKLTEAVALLAKNQASGGGMSEGKREGTDNTWKVVSGIAAVFAFLALIWPMLRPQQIPLASGPQGVYLVQPPSPTQIQPNQPVPPAR